MTKFCSGLWTGFFTISLTCRYIKSSRSPILSCKPWSEFFQDDDEIDVNDLEIDEFVDEMKKAYEAGEETLESENAAEMAKLEKAKLAKAAGKLKATLAKKAISKVKKKPKILSSSPLSKDSKARKSATTSPTVSGDDLLTIRRTVTILASQSRKLIDENEEKGLPWLHEKLKEIIVRLGDFIMKQPDKDLRKKLFELARDSWFQPVTSGQEFQELYLSTKEESAIRDKVVHLASQARKTIDENREQNGEEWMYMKVKELLLQVGDFIMEYPGEDIREQLFELAQDSWFQPMESGQEFKDLYLNTKEEQN